MVICVLQEKKKREKTTSGNWQFQGKGTVPNMVLRKASGTKKGTFD